MAERLEMALTQSANILNIGKHRIASTEPQIPPAIALAIPLAIPLPARQIPDKFYDDDITMLKRYR